MHQQHTPKTNSFFVKQQQQQHLLNPFSHLEALQKSPNINTSATTPFSLLLFLSTACCVFFFSSFPFFLPFSYQNTFNPNKEHQNQTKSLEKKQNKSQLQEGK
jgi:hypothetical protein